MSLIKQTVKKLYINSYVISRLVLKESNSGTRLPFFIKAAMWKLGFFSSSYILYNLKKNAYADYLTDYQENVRAVRLNDGYHHYLDNKILFSALIESGAEVPALYAVIVNGAVQPLGKYHHITTIDEIINHLNKESLILKPVDSASGAGVMKLELKDNTLLKNGQEQTDEGLKKYLNVLSNYIISPVVRQAQYSNNIFPRSVNTIRILTMIDPQNKEPFIAAAAHRFGTNASAPVDNCNAGGLTARIDIETGEMGEAASTYIKGKELLWHEKHPDTQAQIKGIVIPRWKDIRNDILNLCGRISFLNYIGWDIVVTETGFIVLEGNNGPDIKLHQVHAPLLADEKVRKFFQYHKVVK